MVRVLPVPHTRASNDVFYIPTLTSRDARVRGETWRLIHPWLNPQSDPVS